MFSVITCPRSYVGTYPLEQSRLTAPDDTPQTTYFTQVLAGAKNPKGVTLVFDALGTLRYAIPSSKTARD